MAPKIFNFGRNNDAVENQMGGSESPSHGLVYPPSLGFEKIFSRGCFEKCEKIRCLPFHTSSRYKKYIFTLFVRQSCREKYNLPFFILVNEYFFVKIEKINNFFEKNNFENDFFPYLKFKKF